MDLEEDYTITDQKHHGCGNSNNGNARQKPATDTLKSKGLTDRDTFLRSIVRLGASDLHLKSGISPRVRLRGTLKILNLPPVPNQEFEEAVVESLSCEQQRQLREDGSVDLTYDVDGSDRFRVNIYRQESGLSIAARRVTRYIPAFQDLNLPQVIEQIAENKQGLVLVAGVTGSGKSTTLAAMIEHINSTRAEHIVTIEDPIEYLFVSKKSLIDQREVGINVKDFPTALRALVREDPDVVLIGEMRDTDTFRAALQATNTGHLVFGTIHASSCPQTIGRVMDLFPNDEREAIRQSLAFNLRAIITQKLVPSLKEGFLRVPVVEVLIRTPIVEKLIVEKRDAELASVIRSRVEGMQSFADSLEYFVKQDFIDVKTACNIAPNAEELKMQLKGIRQSQRGILR